jgi:hypothetical protein
MRARKNRWLEQQYKLYLSLFCAGWLYNMLKTYPQNAEQLNRPLNAK